MKKKRFFTKAVQHLKILGYEWDFVKDEWSLAKVSLDLDQVTKRSMFSDVASIWDPLGLVNPALVSAKCLLQKC